MTGKKVKIGCASGFWGDSNMSTPQLVASKELDYLVFDYLAEITMSIMARQRASHVERGYAHDFVSKVMPGVLPAIAEQGIRVVSKRWRGRARVLWAGPRGRDQGTWTQSECGRGDGR